MTFRALSACVALCSISALAAPLDCPAPKADKTLASAPERGDPKAREAAQRGLEFLVREATAWQQANKCYGCHVHSVTLEALSVGRQFGTAVSEAYRVPFRFTGKLETVTINLLPP